MHLSSKIYWLLFFCFLISNIACKTKDIIPDSCFNGLLDANEIQIDCGGDCDSCNDFCSDGIKNQDETSTDCGGTFCPLCFENPTDCLLIDNTLDLDIASFQTEFKCTFNGEENGLIAASNNANSRITIEFPSSLKPHTSRNYLITEDDEIKNGEVKIELRVSTGSALVFYYAAKNEVLPIEVAPNGNLKLFFCETLFHNYHTTYGSRVATGSLICD